MSVSSSSEKAVRRLVPYFSFKSSMSCRMKKRKEKKAFSVLLRISGGSIRQDMLALKEKYGTKRRTAFSEDEVADINRDDLIAEEPMVVTLSQRGYVKRTPLSTYEAQNRGGKGITGVKSDEEDDIKHLFVASTHAYLLFFTDRGRVHWQKVYDLPLQSRTSRGRAVSQFVIAEGRGKARNQLPGRSGIHGRAIPDHGDEERNGEENGPLGLQPADEGGHHCHQAGRGRRTDRRADRIWHRRRRAGYDGMACRSGFRVAIHRPMGRATRGVRGIVFRPGML